MGSNDPAIDADVVLVGHEVFRRLDIPVTLLLTSLGDPACRPAYREALLAFLRGLGDRLPAAARARAEQNPLRVLDMKDPLVEELTAEAPLMRDYLCGAARPTTRPCGSSWPASGSSGRRRPGWSAGSTTTSGPPSSGRPGRWTRPRTPSAAAAATTAVGGPRRPPAPGIGWALGLDRTVLALEQAGRLPADPWRLDALVLPLTPAARARPRPWSATCAGPAWSPTSLCRPHPQRPHEGRGQGRARTVVILGEQELAAGQAAVRDMTAREQRPVPLDQVVDQVRRVAAGGAP